MPYNFQLDMTSRNSNSVIINNILPNTKVLEVGCAYGRMTKYLKEQLNCQVDIIEINVAYGDSAKAYARRSFIGNVIGNIETNDCFNSVQYEGQYLINSMVCSIRAQYDYIIFADVLEHTHNPKEILCKYSSLLAKDGKIWISIPNIAHNAVIIDLMKNKFEYRDVGLMDKTHLKFFTSSSLEQMINEIGLNIFKKENLINAVENCEFMNGYAELPLEVARYLYHRPDAEVYQFVWGLEKK